ncbi:MAG: DNA/RNA non-specific endonuclease [Bacteroidales bacterium]|nr:DNA/RNA non-specific endonuclease [Bacteroidales bacterium]
MDKSLLELPAIQEKDIILSYSGFVVNYNPDYLIPNWVAYELTAGEMNGKVPRANGFSMDLSYRDRQAMREDYSNTGWDKGHMAPSADMKWSQDAMSESFYLTNICPQNHDLNGRDWHTLENRVRSWAQKYGRVWVVCGPIIDEMRYGTIGEREVAVPDRFFKAVLRQDEDGAYQAIAFVFDNDSSRQPLKQAVMTVDGLELLTGYNMFANLEDDAEAAAEAQAAWEDWR